MDCKTALQTVLDQVDYTNKACSATEMVERTNKKVLEAFKGL